MAHVALRRRDERSQALSDYVSLFLNMDEPRRRIVGEVSGLDVHYDLGDRHPLLGRRMPDLDLTSASGATRAYALLHTAGPVLLNLSEDTFDLGKWADRVQVINAKYSGTWELPVLGKVNAPNAVLIRPDGYVAWVSMSSDSGLTEALELWFGRDAQESSSARPG
jgi:3-(3-hydroxy-phenyl)propionate hydroxylase